MTPERDAYIEVRSAEAECLRAKAALFRTVRTVLLAVLWAPFVLAGAALVGVITLLLLGGGQ